MALIASSVLPPFSLAVIHAGRLSTPRPRPRGGGMVVFWLFCSARGAARHCARCQTKAVRNALPQNSQVWKQACSEALLWDLKRTQSLQLRRTATTQLEFLCLLVSYWR